MNIVKAAKNQGGYLVIEALIAVVVFALVGVSLFSSISLLQIRSLRSKYDNEAAVLVQEATEIAHTVLLTKWGEYDDGEYYPVFDADENSWILVSGVEEGLQTRYSRTVKIFEVCRDKTSGEQALDFEVSGVCSGEIDKNSRNIVTRVSWKENGGDKEIETRLLLFRVPDE